jgi:hypothetical protein
MKPAFTTLKVKNQGKKLEVTGPIDLDGSEHEGYIWVRVTQSADKNDPQNKPRVDGIGTADRERAELRDEYAKARARLLKKVEDLDGNFGGTGAPLEKAVATATAMWEATVTAEDNGRYRPNERARVEAWALVRTQNPTREFHVYWRENAVTIEA